MCKSIGVLATFCLYASSSAAGLRGISDSSARRLLHNDPAFIHKGCSVKKGHKPEYTNGAHGRGWYCSDHKECSIHSVGKSPQCDGARIHAGCRLSAGLKPKYDAKTATWYCSDVLPSHSGKTCPYTKKLTPCAAYAKHGVHFGKPRCKPDGSQCKASESHPDAFTMYGSTPADNPVWGEAHMTLGMNPDGSQCKPRCPNLEIYLHVRKTHKWENGCGATLWIGSISPANASQHDFFNDYKERCFKDWQHFKGKSAPPHVAVSNEWLKQHSGKDLPAHFTFQPMKHAESKGTCHVKH